MFLLAAVLLEAVALEVVALYHTTLVLPTHASSALAPQLVVVSSATVNQVTPVDAFSC